MPDTLKELIADRKTTEQMFNLMLKYMDELLYSVDMKQSLEDCKWSVLGSYDTDISHEQNMRRVEMWNKLTREGCPLAN